MTSMSPDCNLFADCEHSTLIEQNDLVRIHADLLTRVSPIPFWNMQGGFLNQFFILASKP